MATQGIGFQCMKWMYWTPPSQPWMVIFIMHGLSHPWSAHIIYTSMYSSKLIRIYIKSLLYFIIEIFLFYNNLIILLFIIFKWSLDMFNSLITNHTKWNERFRFLLLNVIILMYFKHYDSGRHVWYRHNLHFVMNLFKSASVWKSLCFHGAGV